MAIQHISLQFSYLVVLETYFNNQVVRKLGLFVIPVWKVMKQKKIRMKMCNIGGQRAWYDRRFWVILMFSLYIILIDIFPHWRYQLSSEQSNMVLVSLHLVSIFLKIFHILNNPNHVISYIREKKMQECANYTKTCPVEGIFIDLFLFVKYYNFWWQDGINIVFSQIDW